MASWFSENLCHYCLFKHSFGELFDGPCSMTTYIKWLRIDPCGHILQNQIMNNNPGILLQYCDISLQTFTMESVHTLGISLFLWRVLPRLSITEACVVFSIVGVIPSALHIISGKRNGSKAKTIIFLTLDIVACILQVAGLIGISFIIYKKYGMLASLTFLLLNFYVRNWVLLFRAAGVMHVFTRTHIHTSCSKMTEMCLIFRIAHNQFTLW